MSSYRVFLLAGVILREEVLLFECHVMRCVCPSMGMDVPLGLHTGQHFLCGLPQTLSLFTRIGNAGLRGQAYKWRVFVGLCAFVQGVKNYLPAPASATRSAPRVPVPSLFSL